MGSKDQYSTHLDGELKRAVEDLREREGGDSKAPKSEALRAIVREWSQDDENGRVANALEHLAASVLTGALVFVLLGLALPTISLWETLAGTVFLAAIGVAMLTGEIYVNRRGGT